MSDRIHTLPELSRLADVTPRTVRFYISQGLLPPPGRPGPGAKYDDRYVNRIRLIRRLQREHLPLAEIRIRLRDLSDQDVAQLVAEPEPPTSSALDYIRRHLAGPEPRRGRVAVLRASHPPVLRPTAPLHVADAAGVGSFDAPGDDTAGRDATAPMRSTWERIGLTPDIELHVRRPLDREGNRAVDRILQFARETLDADREPRRSTP